MFQYEYVTIEVGLSGWGPFAGNSYCLMADHREIINERARDGWRYVGYIPTQQRGTGHMEELELIFEKEV
jgi:hypothetical protein